MLKRDKGRRRDEDEEDDDRPRKKRDRDDDDGGKKKFKFKKRSKEQVSRRESGGMFDAPFKPKFKTFQPKQGDFRVRLMPATYEGAEHYGLDTYVHYGIGVDNNRYLCRRKMEKYTPDEDPTPTCAVCDEFEVAKRDGDDDYAKELRSNRGILVWVIDRDHEKDGPKLWMMPGTVDQEIAKRSVDKRSGDTINPEDPEEGRDIDFSRSGEGIKTKYTGVNLASKATPLSDDEEQQDEWLDFIVENPLDEVLNFFPAEYISKVFGGGAPKGKDKDDDEEEDGPRTRHGKKRSRDEDEDDEDKPRKKSKRDADEDDEDEEDEEDEDDRPRKKRKRVIEDEDEELDEDEDDEDEDDRPRKKKRVQAEEDDDEDDEEDEDDRPRKSKKSKSDDEDEDDEDEEPRKKSKLKDKLRDGLRKRRD